MLHALATHGCTKIQILVPSPAFIGNIAYPQLYGRAPSIVMSDSVFIYDSHDPSMQQAVEAAQQTFKYFWRELSWERQRIIPGLDMAMIKAPFTDGPRTDGNAEHEQMWVGDVNFDGITLSGTLLNAPHWLTSVHEGDEVNIPFSDMTDWLFSHDGVAYGGFTVNVIRASMNAHERKEHDTAWGLDFGKPSEVRLERTGSSKPKGGLLSSLFGRKDADIVAEIGFKDHPMCVNMLEKYEEQLKVDASIAKWVGSDGWTYLHTQALAGNLGVVKLMVKYGADVNAKTSDGRTAAAVALGMGWPEIALFLSKQA